MQPLKTIRLSFSPLLSPLLLAFIGLASADVFAQSACTHRGDLDTQYCDDNKDMVADTPVDPKQIKDPSTLIIGHSPLEDPGVYDKLFGPMVNHIAACTGKKAILFHVQSSAAAVEAMRSGRMHIGMLSTGDTAFAVNVAGAVPYAVRGDAKGAHGSHTLMIAKASGPVKKVADLKGKKVAHVNPSSNSGNLVPRALLAAEGVTPEKEYTVVYSGKHENSVSGVGTGDFDGAAVVEDVFERMIERKLIKREDFRVLWKSPAFPPGSINYAYNLKPDLAKKIVDCTMSYKYSPELVTAFQGADRWLPVTYTKNWEVVRKVAAASGESFNRQAYDKRSAAAKK
jgi:phosphonate transport system substrate-binding protein